MRGALKFRGWMQCKPPLIFWNWSGAVGLWQSTLREGWCEPMDNGKNWHGFDPFHAVHFSNQDIRARLKALLVFAIPDDTFSKFQHLLGELAAAESAGQQDHKPAH